MDAGDVFIDRELNDQGYVVTVTTNNEKIRELTPEELKQVIGGSGKSDYEVPLYTPELEWIEYLITKIDSQE